MIYTDKQLKFTIVKLNHYFKVNERIKTIDCINQDFWKCSTCSFHIKGCQLKELKDTRALFNQIKEEYPEALL